MNPDNEISILFMTPKMIIGGAENYILTKSKFLMNKGYHATIVSEGGCWQNEIEKYGGKHYLINGINSNPFYMMPSEFLNIIEQIIKVIEDQKINIIEANQFYPAIWAIYISMICKTPVILNVLSALSFINNRSNNINLIKLYHDKGVYYNSELSNKLIEKINNFKFERCKEIPIPINENSLENQEKKTILNTHEYILTVSRLDKCKAKYISYLIKDFYKVIMKKNINNLDLLIVGDGELFFKIKHLADKYNRKIKNKGFESQIRLVGTIVDDELQYLFKNCKLYIGMGTTVLEASKFRKCTILATMDKRQAKYATGIFAEKENISLGYRMDNSKLEKFYKIIVSIIDNQKYLAKIGDKAYKIYSERFTLNNVMQIWEQEYFKIINKGPIIEIDSKYEELLINKFRRALHYLKLYIYNVLHI